MEDQAEQATTVRTVYLEIEVFADNDAEAHATAEDIAGDVFGRNDVVSVGFHVD